MISPLESLARQFPRGGTKEFHLFLSSCLPLGEGAERSEAEGGCAPQLNIVPVSSNFPVPKGHNANFVWNQDEVPQNSRYAKNLC